MIRVYADFDGTVCREDVGDSLFRTFGGEEAADAVERLLSGRLNTRQALELQCRAVRRPSRAGLEAFVRRCSLDPGFRTFAEFCDREGIPLVILSDGLDFYVQLLLEREGLGHLRWFANHLEFEQDGGEMRLVPSFPYRDSECEWCANCKRNHMLNMSGDDDVIVYVGDGFSDRCPAHHADVVFAKHELAVYCQKNNITYHEYSDFRDVRERLDQLIRQKRARRRQVAAHARRDVFLQG